MDLKRESSQIQLIPDRQRSGKRRKKRHKTIFSVLIKAAVIIVLIFIP